MKRADKHAEVARMTASLTQVRHAVLLDFRGITVPVDTELRAKIRAGGGHYEVLRNRLATRAVASSPLAKLAGSMKGPTAIAWSEKEPVALAKTVSHYVKTVPALKLKAVLLDGTPIAVEQLSEVANLPSALELRSRLVGLLASPLRRVVTVLSAPPRNLVSVVKQKSEKS